MQNKTLQYRDIEKTFPHFTRPFYSDVSTLPSSKLMSLGLGAVTLRNIVAGYSNKTIPKEFDFFDESLSDVDVSTLDFFVVDPYLVFKLNRDIVQKDVNEVFTNLYADRIYEANERSGGEFSKLTEFGGSWVEWEIATSHSELAQVRKGLHPNIYRSEIEAARKTILKSLVNLYKNDEVHQFVEQYVKAGQCWACGEEKELLKCLSKLEYGTQEYNKVFDYISRTRAVKSEMQSIMERLKDAE